MPLSAVAVSDNRPYTGSGIRTRKGAYVGQVGLWRNDAAKPMLKGKLDTMTAFVFAMAMAVVGVNGPEDAPEASSDWDATAWPVQEERVRRLRQRIFKASREGDLAKVRNLQKLMLRSRANTLVSVRQVAERNAGRKTAGIDGQLALSAQAKTDLVQKLQCRAGPGKALPVRRVYIPKKSGKLRPLGIPVIADRAQQARVRNALEPEWEARFEPKSYGFRPGRSCQDAIEAIYLTLKGPRCQREWILDADLASAFDKVDHDLLLATLGGFPAREQIRAWLKAGMVEQGRYASTEEGTPQGGVISPLLLNIVLHGMEHAAGVRYRRRGNTVPGTPVLVRYADDLVALCHSSEQAEQVRQRLSEWLAPKGLTFNDAKTRIVHTMDGFDFLGFNVRRYRTWRGGKVLIKPGKDAVNRIRQRLSDEMRSLRGADSMMIISRLNPIIRGWAAYYRSGVSSKIFSSLDDYVWGALYRWTRRRHPTKPRYWINSRYFGRFHQARQDKWVFGDRATGAFLHKFCWTNIVRHTLVKHAASPDDPALTQYWADRRRRRPPPVLAPALAARARAQRGRCPECGELLLHADHEPNSPSQWEQWFTAIRVAITRQAISTPNRDAPYERHRLIHTHCLNRRYPIGPEGRNQHNNGIRTSMEPA
jgi:RNA-directed DNA polymerase